jgi:hypothetical protein
VRNRQDALHEVLGGAPDDLRVGGSQAPVRAQCHDEQRADRLALVLQRRGQRGARGLARAGARLDLLDAAGAQHAPDDRRVLGQGVGQRAAGLGDEHGATAMVVIAQEERGVIYLQDVADAAQLDRRVLSQAGRRDTPAHRPAARVTQYVKGPRP